MRRSALLIAAAVAIVSAALAAAAAPAQAAQTTRIATYPKLYPAFSKNVTDYVSRCQRNRPLLVALRAPTGTKTTIDRNRTPRRKARLTLSAGQETKVRIGKRTYRIRCIPRNFPRWTAERNGKPQARWYIVTPAEGGKGSRYVAIFDTNGVPIWWMKQAYKPVDAKLLPNGNLAWSEFTDAPYATHSVPYEERTLSGKLVRRIAAVGMETDFHELQLLPNGNYLIGGYPPRDGVDLSAYGGPENATVTDAEIQEVTPDGKLVWRWNSKDHVALEESKPWMGSALTNPQRTSDGRLAYDIAHFNSIEHAGDSLLISLRHTDSVYKVNRATGAVEWKLGGTRTPQSLRVEGEPEDSTVFRGQHDARLLPDGTITLHDNRSGTQFTARALRYRIDEAARTATTVEEITDPQIILSLCCGSARRLPRGNWVMSWGFHALVSETNPAGRRIFSLTFYDLLFSYRAVPVVAGEGLSTRKLRMGMNAMHPR